MKLNGISAMIALLLCVALLTGCSTMSKMISSSEVTTKATAPDIIKKLEDFGVQNAKEICADEDCVEGRWAAVLNTQNLDASTTKDIKLILRNSNNCTVQNLSDGSTVLVINGRDKQSDQFHTCYKAALFVITDFDAMKASIKGNMVGIDAVFKLLGLSLP